MFYEYSLAARCGHGRRIHLRACHQFEATGDTSIFPRTCYTEMRFRDIDLGTPLQPVVNPMLGPSSSALIFVGARFPPCMKDVTTVPITTQFPCALTIQ